MNIEEAVKTLESNDPNNEHIEVSVSRLNGEDIRRMAIALADNQVLKSLDLSNIGLHPGLMRYLAKALAANKTLQTLYLEGNPIGIRGARQLAEAVRLHPALRLIYGAQQDLGDKGFEILDEAARNNEHNPGIRIIKLGQNAGPKLNYDGIRPLTADEVLDQCSVQPELVDQSLEKKIKESESEQPLERLISLAKGSDQILLAIMQNMVSWRLKTAIAGEVLQDNINNFIRFIDHPSFGIIAGAMLRASSAPESLLRQLKNNTDDWDALFAGIIDKIEPPLTKMVVDEFIDTTQFLSAQNLRQRYSPSLSPYLPHPELPHFAYLPHPMISGCIDEYKKYTQCEVCHQAKRYFGIKPPYSPYEEPEEPLICVDCIANGQAAASFEGPFTANIENESALPKQTVDIIYHRTPGFDGWQEEFWLSHCNDACLFLGMVHKMGIKLIDSFYKGAQAFYIRRILADLLNITDIDPESIEVEQLYDELFPGFYSSVECYLFKCRHCGEFRYYQDSD